MAIEVIKHGRKKKEMATCPFCECEFTYEQEDVQYEDRYIPTWSITTTGLISTYKYPYVICPDCGQRIYLQVTYDFYYNGQPLNVDQLNDLTSTGTFDPCKNCINKDGPKDAFGNPTVGDSPCQWCSHSPFKVTCK